VVKSEVVVSIFADKKAVAEIDAEGYFADRFLDIERRFVEACPEIVADRNERIPGHSVASRRILTVA
jgi:putative methionine-R-sulfoxide reductase with GAF domain